MSLPSGQRKGVEDKMDGQYPITCTDCKDQFRTPLGLDIHTNTNGCMRTSPSVSQDNGKKLPRDVVCVTPPFTATSMSVRAPSAQSHDLLKAQQTSNFLHEQEMPNFARMADITTQESCGAAPPPYHCASVYPSRLHAEGKRAPASPSAGAPHYTPLPMLNPARKGSGLFTNLAEHSSESVGSPFACNQYNGLDLIHQENSTQVESWTPCINVGHQFQATLPDLMEASLADQDKHTADLVWRPWKGLIDNPDTQQKVEDMLNMACSSVLPGGGTNREFALHCLFEEGADIMAVLERLLLNTKVPARSEALASYHYTGSCSWTFNERKAFNKAFGLHKKDFYTIQKMVKSKPIAECVEYYYSFKKILKFNKKPRLRPLDAEEDCGQVFRQDSVNEPPLRSQSLEPIHRERQSPCPTVIGNFPCKQCGKMFYKIKSRNAHMKIHRQQDDWQHRSQDGYYPTATYTPPSLGKAPTAAYSNWDNRVIQEHLDAVTEAMTCTNLPPIYQEEIKLNFGKEKCQNIFI
uniref:Transcriptional-regulating factor 1-like n=2 Tax=Callorhinchus milii TaxID=7868 RepID=A0A4W3H769_CALMI